MLSIPSENEIPKIILITKSLVRIEIYFLVGRALQVIYTNCSSKHQTAVQLA